MFANPDTVGVVSVFQFDSDLYSAPDNVDNSGFSLSQHVLATSRKAGFRIRIRIRIRINLSCWIRIRIKIADPDPGGEK
jgi:hypothetical protein